MEGNVKAQGVERGMLVNICDDYELGYWSKKWGVTPEELREAVARVGVSAPAVIRDLCRKR